MRVKIEELGNNTESREYHTQYMPRIGETVVVSPDGFEARIIDIKHGLFREHFWSVEPILIVARIAEDGDSDTQNG